MIALHPEPTDDPVTLRWIVPPGTLPPGSVRRAPHPLEALRDDVWASMTVESDAVRVTLVPGRSWRAEGARVRSALEASLKARDEWAVVPPSDPDEMLRAAAAEVLAGPVGDFARSHGGRLALADVHDGVVTLDAHGACSSCPAIDLTLKVRVATAIAKRDPGLREVRLDAEAPARRRV